MLEKKIDELREKLHSLILEEADYNSILKISQELDEYIVEYQLFKIKCKPNKVYIKQYLK